MFRPDFTLRSKWQGNSHWMETNVTWKKVSESKGININTCDITPPGRAEVVIHMDLPGCKKDLEKYTSNGSNAKHILLLKESPLWPYWFTKRNHDFFDLVLTYNSKLIDNKRYFHCPLPKSSPPNEMPARNWIKRKPMVLLNTNIYRGVKDAKTPLHYLRTLKSFRNNGWEFTFRDVIKYDRSFLYNERRKVVRCAEKYYPGILDVFGNGWHGRVGGWYYRLCPEKAIKQNRGLYKGEKLELFNQYRFVLAFENFRGDVGYISEKLFDAMYGGAIPVYLGDENITDYVDKACFIDARDFKNYKELLSFVNETNEKTWLKFRNNIDKYLRSESIKFFLPQRNAERIINAIKLVLRK